MGEGDEPNDDGDEYCEECFHILVFFGVRLIRRPEYEIYSEKIHSFMEMMTLPARLSWLARVIAS